MKQLLLIGCFIWVLCACQMSNPELTSIGRENAEQPVQRSGNTTMLHQAYECMFGKTLVAEVFNLHDGAVRAHYNQFSDERLNHLEFSWELDGALEAGISVGMFCPVSDLSEGVMQRANAVDVFYQIYLQPGRGGVARPVSDEQQKIIISAPDHMFFKSIDSLGDAAAWRACTHYEGGIELVVLKNEQIFRISIMVPGDISQNLEKATLLAQRVLANRYQ